MVRVAAGERRELSCVGCCLCVRILASHRLGIGIKVRPDGYGKARSANSDDMGAEWGLFFCPYITFPHERSRAVGGKSPQPPRAGGELDKLSTIFRC